MGEISADRVELVEGKTPNSSIEIASSRIEPFDKEANDDQWRELYIKSKPYIKPTFEGLAMGGGAVVGSSAGPVGTVAGGALGYAGVKQGFDYLDTVFGVRESGTVKEEIIGGLENIKEGTEYAVGGELLGGVIGGVVKGATALGRKVVPPLRPPAIRAKAGRELITQGTDLTEEQIPRNIFQAREIEKQIPGLQFTRGQLTNNAQAIALERSLVRSGTRFKRGRVEVSGADLNQEQRAFAEQALQDYYNSKLVKGNLDDFTKIIGKEKEVLEKTVADATEIVDTEVARLSRAMDEQDIAPIILETIKGKQVAAKGQAKRLYDAIPDIKLETDVLQDAITSIVKSEDKIIEPRTLKMLGLIKRITTKNVQSGEEVVAVAKKTGYQALRKLRSRVGKNIREARGGQTPSLEDARQLSLVQQAIDDTMKQIEAVSPEAQAAYKKAGQYYAKEYIPKFRQGTVADVLQQGIRGEETKIAMTNIAGKFFTKDGIKHFYNAVGDDAIANSAMVEYANFDLFNKAYNPYTGKLDVKKATGWLHKNKTVLREIGVDKDFINTVKYGKQLEINEMALEVFNKSVAGRILGVAPEKAVAEAFGTSKNYAATANELVKTAKGDKAAEEGIKSAVAEHILKSSKVTAEGFLTDSKVSVAKLTTTLNKFMPALRVLYKGEPEKIKAIINVNKAYKIANRTTASPIGGGSDTMENISHILAAATGARAGRYYLIISIKKAFSQYSENQINKYLLRASFDSEFAANLTSLARANELKKIDASSEIKRFERLMRKVVEPEYKQLYKGEVPEMKKLIPLAAGELTGFRDER